MRYYKRVSDQNELLSIGTNPGGIEITETEYMELFAMIREKACLEAALYSGAITVSEVPPEWREEIQRRVDEQKEREAVAEENAEATEDDYIFALAELGVIVNEEN